MHDRYKLFTSHARRHPQGDPLPPDAEGILSCFHLRNSSPARFDRKTNKYLEIPSPHRGARRRPAPTAGRGDCVDCSWFAGSLARFAR